MARAAVFACLSLIAGACGRTSVRLPAEDGQIDAGLSQDCIDAVDHSDLEWIQEKIFTPSCSRFNACHKGQATSAARLNLEAGQAFERLCGPEEAGQCTNTSRLCRDQDTPVYLLVKGDPGSSMLMKVLGNYPVPEVNTDECIRPPGPNHDDPIETMPYNNPLLCREKRDAVERWIESLDDAPDAGVPDAADPGDAEPSDAEPPDANPPDAPIDA